MNELISCIKNLPKHLKTALQNIWRNGVMSISSIFAVTITLLLIGVIGILALNVQDMSSSIEEGVRIYVKLERDIDSAREQAIGDEIKNIKGVEKVTFFTKDEELDKYGVNNSLTHVDFMIGSNDMNIVGITHQGEEVQVFKDGNWAF